MEVLLVDIGALAMFLGYMALVYWHGITHDARPATRKADRSDSARRGHALEHCIDVATLDDRTICAGAVASSAHYLGRDSATARSARSSVEIGQCSSQLLQ
jgi:hypothetical protein